MSVKFLTGKEKFTVHLLGNYLVDGRGISWGMKIRRQWWRIRKKDVYTVRFPRGTRMAESVNPRKPRLYFVLPNGEALMLRLPDRKHPIRTLVGYTFNEKISFDFDGVHPGLLPPNTQAFFRDHLVDRLTNDECLNEEERRAIKAYIALIDEVNTQEV